MSDLLSSLSLDLDNKWSYLKTHGDAGWEAFPSYLDVVVPRVLNLLRQRGLTITFFVVGQDAALAKNHDALRMIADAGHEIGNHSFHHEPWLHLYSPQQLDEEITNAEEAIQQATGQRPIGFRGPGFSFSTELHRQLAARGYAYDASTFPTFIGPLARAYYFMTASLSKQQRQDRKKLFGSWWEGFRSLKPYELPIDGGRLLEIPVTTMPLLRAPIHLSYLLYLARRSRLLARCWFSLALSLCRLRGVQPSILLHPLDFLGCDDEPDMGFFPAMDMYAADKVELAGWMLDRLAQDRTVVTMRQHAETLLGEAILSAEAAAP